MLKCLQAEQSKTKSELIFFSFFYNSLITKFDLTNMIQWSDEY